MTPGPPTRSRRGAEFLKRVSESVLVADGAMGTMLYRKGVFINHCFDALNVTRPELVRSVHEEYLAAGADLVETNTFGANRVRLLGYGYEDQVEDLNLAGARLAKEATGDRAFVAGSMGPIGLQGKLAGNYTADDLVVIFGQQAGPLIDGGVDLIIIETMPGLSEMKAAIAGIREVDSEVPIVASMTFTEEGLTTSGETPEEVALGIVDEVQVVGANCSVGPKPMMDCLTRMGGSVDATLAAMPNAGLPQSVDGRLIYMASPEYFGKYAKRFVKAGVRLLGGCCGTTPDHVRCMKSEVVGFVPGSREVVAEVVDPGDRKAPTPKAEPAEESTRLARQLAEPDRFIASVEVTPPKSADLDGLLEGVRQLREAGVEVVNIPEYARISPRPTPLAIARTIRETIGVETIIHYCCRDRNLAGMQADLLSAHALGIRDVLIVTGDPPKAGEYVVPTGVFDVDSIGLTKVAAGLKRGVDAAGRRTGVPLALHLGVAVNPGAIDLERELERFQRKVDSGAEFAMTQPVFDSLLMESFLSRLGSPPLPILVGILPLHSFRNAEFLHNEIPGMRIPQSVRERMGRASSRQEARNLGIDIAREALAGVKGLDGVAGAYVMPPFGKYDTAVEVLRGFS